MSHDPQKTSINGKPAEWNAEIRELWALVVAAHFDKETRPTVSANYYTPRPYVDEYNRGSDRSGFVYVVGRDVCQHIFAAGARVAKLP